jgi:hypothetical protein
LFKKKDLFSSLKEKKVEQQKKEQVWEKKIQVRLCSIERKFKEIHGPSSDEFSFPKSVYNQTHAK